MNHNLKLSLTVIFTLFCIMFFFCCESIKPVQPDLNLIQEKAQSNTTTAKINTVPTGGLEEATVSPLLGELNDKIAAEGKNVRVALAEWITNLGNDQVGRTVYFANIGNKQLSAHWVPGDPRRSGYTNITWLVDQVEGTPNGVSLTNANLAIGRAMDTWDRVNSISIPLVQVSDGGMDWGYVQYLLGMGGDSIWYADITHAGWLGKAFFDSIAVNGSTYILGVTYTLVWVDSNGDPTDMDHNGKMDVAFREIYYNNRFVWGINAGYPLIDVESIVLHETGHGLSQAHFGTLFVTDSNGKPHFSPLAVMNAGYVYVPWHKLMGTDIAGHCSIWASWPKN